MMKLQTPKGFRARQLPSSRGAESALVAMLGQLFAAAGEQRDVIHGEVTHEKSNMCCVHSRKFRIRNQLLVFTATYPTA
jgi:hypothetical protein